MSAVTHAWFFGVIGSAWLGKDATASRARLIYIQSADDGERQGASDCQEDEGSDRGVSALPKISSAMGARFRFRRDDAFACVTFCECHEGSF